MRSLREFLADADVQEAAAPDLRLYRERLGNLLSALEVVDEACEALLPRDPRELAALWSSTTEPGKAV
jgi:hypothetical protein